MLSLQFNLAVEYMYVEKLAFVLGKAILLDPLLNFIVGSNLSFPVRLLEHVPSVFCPNIKLKWENPEAGTADKWRDLTTVI